VRVLGLTWFYSNEFAGTSNSKDKQGNFGLTEKGRKLVALANDLGMVIDVSHASDQTVLDVAALSSQPFIASHSCARGIQDIERNLSDELLKLIASKGGVIGVNFHRGYVSDKPRDQVKLEDVADQIIYITKVAGIDAVALGSDFDGSSPPSDLDGAHRMQDLALHLSKRGFSDEDIAKIMYRNALRLFTRVTEGADIESMIDHTHPLALVR
jgi:membrane dipeptidase